MQQQNKFREQAKTAALDRWYRKRLKAVAKQIAQIALEWEGSDPSQLQLSLFDYSVRLDEWARSVADIMLRRAASADYDTWLRIGQKISRETRRKLKDAAAGPIFNRLREEQVALIRSLPMEAAKKAQEWAVSGLSDGQRYADIAQRIKKYYRRDSDVIYPCCHINESPFVEKEDFYLTVGRLTWYKRVDLAVQACTRLNKRLVVIGGGGELDKLRAMAGPTIEFKGGGLSDEEVRSYYLRAKGFLFPGEEDFGITPVEAQSAGTPVLAYGRGGACESVLPGRTGYWFKEQTVESLADCIERFERDGVACSKEEIREHSRSFSEERFERELKEYCLRRMADWQQELLDCSHWEKEELD